MKLKLYKTENQSKKNSSQENSSQESCQDTFAFTPLQYEGPKSNIHNSRLVYKSKGVKANFK